MKGPKSYLSHGARPKAVGLFLFQISIKIPFRRLAVGIGCRGGIGFLCICVICSGVTGNEAQVSPPPARSLGVGIFSPDWFKPGPTSRASLPDRREARFFFIPSARAQKYDQQNQYPLFVWCSPRTGRFYYPTRRQNRGRTPDGWHIHRHRRQCLPGHLRAVRHRTNTLFPA